MRYYKVKTRILFQTKENGKIIGFGAKMPTYMKQYPYYKLAYKASGTEAILQSEADINEAEELTVIQAQKQVDVWTEDHEDVLTDELDENNKMTGIVLKTRPVPVKVAKYNDKDIKIRMDTLHKGVS